MAAVTREPVPSKLVTSLFLDTYSEQGSVNDPSLPYPPEATATEAVKNQRLPGKLLCRRRMSIGVAEGCGKPGKGSKASKSWRRR